jgi:hypothetical protein
VVKKSGSHLRALGWTTVSALTVVFAANGFAAPPSNSMLKETWHRFEDPRLGFSFEYPTGWVVAVGCHGSQRCVSVSVGRRSVDDYSLALEVFAGGLEQVATDKAVFHRKPGSEWAAKGRYSDYPVDHVTGNGWRGLQASVGCGASPARECLWAVLSNGRTSVVADTQGSSPIEEVRDIIKSVRFVGHQ